MDNNEEELDDENVEKLLPLSSNVQFEFFK